MRKLLTVALLIGTTGLYALHAQDERDTATPASGEVSESAKAQELVATLTQGYEEALQAFSLARSEVHNVIRLNEKLYRAQLEYADATRRRSIVQDFVDRAERIETLAEEHMAQGTGTHTAILEAKASRLQGHLDLEKLEQ